MRRTRWRPDDDDERDDMAGDHRCPSCETPLPVSALVGRRRARTCDGCRQNDRHDEGGEG